MHLVEKLYSSCSTSEPDMKNERTQKSIRWTQAQKKILELAPNQILWLRDCNIDNNVYILTLDDCIYVTKPKGKALLAYEIELITMAYNGHKYYVTLSIETSDSEEPLLAEVQRSLCEYDTVTSQTIEIPIGQAKIWIFKANDKKKEMAFFTVQITKNLYFVGDFWFCDAENSNVNTVVAALFQGFDISTL